MPQGRARIERHALNHLGGGSDPIPGVTSTFGPGLAGIIGANSPVGLWKLNETTGSTAADSSGAGNDMTVPGGGYLAPTWGAAAGPPGTLSATFVKEPVSSNAGTRLNVTLPGALTDDFSAGTFAYFPSAGDPGGEIIGCGTPTHAGGSGWTILLNPTFYVQVAMNGTLISSDAPVSLNAWHFVGFTREAGVTSMYVAGDAQAATTGAAPTAQTAAWIGNDGFSTAAGGHGLDARLSWAFMTDAPLSAENWANAFASGSIGGAAVPTELGKVWTAAGDGTASWEYPTIEVEF